jgi:hypothetical protein
MNITKLIPFEIRIKSLYWVRKEREIDSDLSNLFSTIDDDEYELARVLLNNLKNKWTELSFNSPEWFKIDYISQFSKAEAMLNFLETPLEN